MSRPKITAHVAHPNRKNAKPYYYEVADRGIIVCSQQRAGSTSIAESLKPSHADFPFTSRIEPQRVVSRRREGWPVVYWLRNPLEKFASAYSIFGKNSRAPGRFKNASDLKHPWNFFDAAKEYLDGHWAPQTKVLTFNGEFLPTKVYAFESIAQTWPLELPNYPLLHRNDSNKRVTYKDKGGKVVPGRRSWDQLAEQLTEEQIDQVANYFSEDIKMHTWCMIHTVMERAA